MLSIILVLLIIALGFIELFFPRIGRRIRGIHDNAKGEGLVYSDRYILSFRVAGFLMIIFGVVLIGVRLLL